MIVDIVSEGSRTPVMDPYYDLASLRGCDDWRGERIDGASMDSKQKKEFLGLLMQIVMKGRSVSCFWF